MDDVSSETARVGDVVQMEVLGDVLVKGYVVVGQGATAIGQISRVKESQSMGRRGNVALTLSYIEAVTGEHILVGGNRAEKGKGKAAKLASEIVVTTALTGGLIGALWLFEKGHDVSIPPGTTFSVYTVGDTTIDLSLLAPQAAIGRGTPLPNLVPDSPLSPSEYSEPPNTSPVTAMPRAMSSSSMAFPLLGVVVKTRVNLGAEVIGIAHGSVAEKAGLQVGYIIAEVDGNPIRSVRDLVTVLANRLPGSKIRMVWLFRSNLGWMPGAERVMILAGAETQSVQSQ